jgi:hypothetical protein
MQIKLERQTGQSVIIIVFALVALVALLALVVDAGNAYVQRRQIQNAMDSGAQAGALALAQGKNSGQINTAINQFVQANGVDPNDVRAYYVVQDANRNNIVVRDRTIAAYGAGFYPNTINYNGVELPVVGVQVEGSKTFNTFFANVIGVRQMPAGGASAAYATKGACTGSGLFPIAVSSGNFPIDQQTGVMQVHYEEDNPTYVYKIWQKDSDLSPDPRAGNFGWLFWRGQNSSAAVLADNMNNAESGVSGTWSVGELIPGNTGISASDAVRQALRDRIDGVKPSSVVVPVYDEFSGTGNNARYRIIGFAKFKITCFRFGNGASQTYGNCVTQNPASGDKFIEGKFQKWVDPSAEGGCANFGVSSVKVRPPVNPQRALVGSIKVQKLTLTQSAPSYVHVPVDVALVIDTSGSMGDTWQGTSTSDPTKTKLYSAKQALTLFSNNLRPDLGDKAALINFPLVSTGSQYSYNCESSGRTSNYYTAKLQLGLTTNITGTNGIVSKINDLTASGYTPIAGAMKMARETVLGSGHNPNAVAVILFASDGMTNVRLNGRITGYDGRGTAPTCNQPAEQEALDEANIAKGDYNPVDYRPDAIIFSIAIGTDFNPALLQAMATPDTDPNKPHYYRATDAASMAQIYQTISQRVQQIGTETCQIITSEDFARGANVTIRYPNGTTRTVTTTSNGEFILTGSDVVDGTYTIVAASVTINGITYNVLTDGLGGPPLGSNPTVTVGTASGTYRTDLFLKAGTTPTCGN